MRPGMAGTPARLAGQIIQDGLFDGPELGLDLVQRTAALLDGGIGVLEAMAGQGAVHVGRNRPQAVFRWMRTDTREKWNRLS
jgi:hypothetical protein